MCRCFCWCFGAASISDYFFFCCIMHVLLNNQKPRHMLIEDDAMFWVFDYTLRFPGAMMELRCGTICILALFLLLVSIVRSTDPATACLKANHCLPKANTTYTWGEQITMEFILLLKLIFFAFSSSSLHFRLVASKLCALILTQNCRYVSFAGITLDPKAFGESVTLKATTNCHYGCNISCLWPGTLGTFSNILWIWCLFIWPVVCGFVTCSLPQQLLYKLEERKLL